MKRSTGHPFHHPSNGQRRGPRRTRRLACAAGLTATLLAAGAAQASLVRVNLGIYGGLTNDLDAYVGSGGATRVVAAVRGDLGAVRLNDAGTAWESVFWGRPGEAREVEVDINTVGSGAGTVYVLLPDGQLVANASEVSGVWTRGAFTTVTNGGVFHDGVGVVEGISTVLADATGTYVGTVDGNIYRSTDGGSTWSLLATPAASARVYSIAAYVDDPTNPTLYCTVDNAGAPELYKLSYSGGYSATGPASVPGSGGVFERVFVYPSTSIGEAPLLFVTGNSPSQSVYRGENDGASWSTVTEPMHYFQQMRFDATNDRIYAVSGVSTDRGLSFTAMPNFSRTEGDIHSNDGAMDIDPNDSSAVFYASDWFLGLWTESAGSWTATGELASNDGVGAILIDDMHQIADNATTKDTFIIGGKSGVGITSDFLSHTGVHPTWTYPIYPSDDGAPVLTTRLQDYDGDGTVMETVFAGNDSGKLYKSSSQGLTAAAYTKVFDVTADAAGYFTDADRVAINELVESTSTLDEMYLAFGDWDFGNIDGGIACSIDNGATWSMDPAWVTMGDSMSVNALIFTNTKFWAGVGKYDDADTAHMGLYAKIGSLSGCGTGTWTQEITGTAIDTSIVHDLDGPTTSPLYVASSAGLFRGELNTGVWSWQELTGSADPQLALLPNNPGDAYKAVAYNPSAPAGWDEEFFAAVSDQVWRVRYLAPATWQVNLISPSPHEEVRVLLWDDLIVGSADGLASLGEATRDQQGCLAAAGKTRTKHLDKVRKALAKCRDNYVAGGPSCPDAKATAAIDKARAKINLASRCDDTTVAQLASEWTGSCYGAATTAELAACIEADAEAAVDAAIAAEYGAEDPGRVGVAAACQKAIGKEYGKGVLAKSLKALDGCEKARAKAEVVECPDAGTLDELIALFLKAADRIAKKCSDADVAALDALGFGGSCSGVANAADLATCLGDEHQDIVEGLLAVPEDEF